MHDTYTENNYYALIVNLITCEILKLQCLEWIKLFYFFKAVYKNEQLRI